MTWTTRCAERIAEEFAGQPWEPELVDVERCVAIITEHAEPLLALLAEARRTHHRGYNEESCDYPPCPKSEEDASNRTPCTCGADAWNAKIDEVLK